MLLMLPRHRHLVDRLSVYLSLHCLSVVEKAPMIATRLGFAATSCSVFVATEHTAACAADRTAKTLEMRIFP